MNIRDLISLTGSFFQNVIKETNSHFDLMALLYDDIYQGLFNIIDARNIDDLHERETVKFGILKLKFTKTGGKFIPDNGVNEVATFYISDDNNITFNSADYIYGIGGTYDNTSDGSIAFDEEEYAFYTEKPVGNFLTNKLIKPDAILIKDSDYYLGPNTVIIKRSALEANNIAERLIYNINGEVSGKEIILYITDAEVATRDLYNRHGYLVDIETEDTELIKNIFRLFLFGPRIAYIKAAFSLILGLPVILEAQETIKSFHTISGYQYIVTDKNTYRAPIDAILCDDIAVGSTLNQLDLLFSNITLYDSGEWWDQFEQLEIPNNIVDNNSTGVIIKNVVKGIEASNQNAAIMANDYIDLDLFQAGVGDKDKFYLKPGLKNDVGEVIKAGDIRKDVRINIMDYFFGLFWRNSLYYFKINRAGLEEADILKLNSVFDEIMPKHTYPIYYIYTDVPVESCTLSDEIKPLECDAIWCQVWKVPHVNHLTDTGFKSDYWNNNVRAEQACMSDGYYGPLRIGGFLVGEPAAIIGEICFTSVPFRYLS